MEDDVAVSLKRTRNQVTNPVMIVVLKGYLKDFASKQIWHDHFVHNASRYRQPTMLYSMRVLHRNFPSGYSAQHLDNVHAIKGIGGRIFPLLLLWKSVTKLTDIIERKKVVSIHRLAFANIMQRCIQTIICIRNMNTIFHIMLFIPTVNHIHIRFPQ